MSDETVQHKISGLVEVNTLERYVFQDKQVIAIGRDTDCDIPLSNDPFASRRHALIKLKHGAFWLEDAGSNNGTVLNHNTLTEPVQLKVGDEVLIGRTRFKVE